MYFIEPRTKNETVIYSTLYVHIRALKNICFM